MARANKRGVRAVMFSLEREKDKGVLRKTCESSDEIIGAFGEYLSNRLGVTASIIVASSEEGKIFFSVDGTDSELAGLIVALLQMAPPSVTKEIVRRSVNAAILGD